MGVEPLQGTPWLESLGWVVIALLVTLSLVLGAGVMRRFVLLRSGGAVECYLRVRGGKGRRGSWRIGFGRYGSDAFGWFPILSLRPRPTARLSRRGLVVVGRRSPGPGDVHPPADANLPAHVTVLEIGWTAADGSDPEEATHEVAMGESALTGFLSWIESMPPGTRWEA
ncbi:MAG: DUF2550 domain-containing protein [Nocardiopsis sp. BM-2018]|uniref:DUF2550 domain-containing protein n=1 Tax=Nocardiopsis metallicus TaxID=179819 RepID=UPI00160CD920|nr:DUF2550 domain-containing protein [Nocardiopsis metallicus]QRN79104.1 MAG: DUF2550 domain-containing protein [Nocardiopsis sp. BM-2018]